MRLLSVFKALCNPLFAFFNHDSDSVPLPFHFSSIKFCTHIFLSHVKWLVWVSAFGNRPSSLTLNWGVF